MIVTGLEEVLYQSNILEDAPRDTGAAQHRRNIMKYHSSSAQNTLSMNNGTSPAMAYRNPSRKSFDYASPSNKHNTNE